MHHNLLCVIAIALTTTTTPSWGDENLPDNPLNLTQAIELALKQNPDLAVFEWDERIAEARRLQAGLRINPELSFEIEDLRFSDEPKSITTLGNEREIEDGASGGLEYAEFTISLSQIIELGGKRLKRIQVAESEGHVFQR